jgi:hypothetical protein
MPPFLFSYPFLFRKGTNPFIAVLLVTNKVATPDDIMDSPSYDTAASYLDHSFEGYLEGLLNSPLLSILSEIPAVSAYRIFRRYKPRYPHIEGLLK